MEQVGPLCNGLSTMQVSCKQCGHQMDDAGMVTDYLSDYSPYWRSPYERAQHENCTHLFWCPQCDHHSYAIVHQDKF